MIGGLKVKFERRQRTSVLLQVLSVLAGLLAAFLVSSLLIASAGANVGQALVSILKGSFGGWVPFVETLVQATPLIFTGLAIVVAFQARIWNIGAEGQFFAGAMAAFWVGMHLTGVPRELSVVILILTSLTAGAIWGLIPGILKTRLKVNEVITTVMMNYIILYILSFLLNNWWRDPKHYYLQTASIPDTAHFPLLFQGQRLHLGFLISLLVAGVVFTLLKKTPLGYDIRAIGSNPVASKYKGILINKTTILIMLISGAIAGLAGGCELAGLHHLLRLDISTGYGYVGIVIALIGRLTPIGVIIAAVFFGALVNGSTSMQITTGVPVALVYSLQGIVLLFVLAAEKLFQYRIRRIYVRD